MNSSVPHNNPNMPSGKVASADSEITSRSAKEGNALRHSFRSPDRARTTKTAWQSETEYRLEHLEWENAFLANTIFDMFDLMQRMAKNDISDGLRLMELEFARWRDHPPDKGKPPN